MRALPLVLVLGLAPAASVAQTCASSLFGDGVCDCGCGSIDPDCPTGSKFDACERSHCSTGQVPWEHQPFSCMASACGDGWNDSASGEACDDGNALNSGGCSADCTTVMPGYVCGERAQGCRLAPNDAGLPDAGRPASDVDAGAGGGAGGGTGAGGGAPPTTQGCTATGASVTLSLALLALRRRRAA